jgi:1-aminocyclopropane-1-carboxylate deaminase
MCEYKSKTFHLCPMDTSAPDFLNDLLVNTIPIEPLHIDGSGHVECSVARLDLIHPVVGGNKLFKLWYYLEAFRKGGFERILTYGGPYSNHLLATAYVCRELGIPCTGVVRGETPAAPGPTLEDCVAYGMDLRFVSREAYREGAIKERGAYIIPEGGAGELGIRGAGLIMGAVPGASSYTHILCATGTGTTLQGIDRALLAGQSALGIPVIAVPEAEEASFKDSLGCSDRTRLAFSYAFGGYGRRSGALIAFMRTFYEGLGVPTDFVYTAKAAFALRDLTRQGYFPRGSRVLLLHTGGLQGNRSLPIGLIGF